ncbi:MAG: helix-turn-helix domain-containing protein [Wujia sp.]
MNMLNLSENILRLRRERKITQEELADFAGVTKASVSKWESGKSTPDIMLLPLLASFFDVTVDELIGYEPQLSKEQIRRIYGELTSDFATLPFAEAKAHAVEYAHRYYSCYPFLLQITVLYLNHFMLAPEKEQGILMLRDAEQYCIHISKHCEELSVRRDAASIHAILCMQLGKTQEAIEMLEPLADPMRISGQDDMLLIQAYQQAGDLEMAKSHTQIRAYLHLLSLMSAETTFLALHAEESERCEQTIARVLAVVDTYRLDSLHPNVAAQFYFHAAVVYAMQAKNEQTFCMLEKFIACVKGLLAKPYLAADEYFNHIDTWIEQLPLGDMLPRDKSFIVTNTLQALSHPVFADLKESEAFQKLLEQIKGNVL